MMFTEASPSPAAARSRDEAELAPIPEPAQLDADLRCGETCRPATISLLYLPNEAPS